VTSPIVGCSTLDQVLESLEAFDRDLSHDAYAAVNAIFDDEPAEPPSPQGNNFPMLRKSLELLAR